MPHTFANTMFSAEAKRLQQRHGSRAAYENMAKAGAGEQRLGAAEAEFIGERDSFYLATVTADGWPYVQHRGGPAGFLQVLDEQTIAFGDYAGNNQYISAGNLATNDRVALFLMDYPNQTRLKLIGHARVVEPGAGPELEAKIVGETLGLRVERLIVINVVGFDWNCSQHITPRYTREEMKDHFPAGLAGK